MATAAQIDARLKHLGVSASYDELRKRLDAIELYDLVLFGPEEARAVVRVAHNSRRHQFRTISVPDGVLAVANRGGEMSEHFAEAELTFSSTALRLGIQNVPDEETRTHLNVLAAGLEKVRELLGHPMHIDSGYRCPALNAAVHGSATSAHVQGYAADFTCRYFGEPIDVVREIESSNIVFDQCVFEGTWVHISFAPAARKQILTAHFHAGAATTYTEGVYDHARGMA